MKSGLAKVLHQLDGRPLINHVVETAMLLQPRKIYVVVGHQKDDVAKAVTGEFGTERTAFVWQKEQLGTGDAVNAARDELANADSTLMVLSGDVPMIKADTLAELRRIHDTFRNKGAACTLLSVRLKDPTGYGRVVRDENGSFERIVEQKDASDEEKLIDEINAGIWCFETKKLFDALGLLDNNNAQKEYYLTDIPRILSDAGEEVAIFQCSDPAQVEGINDRSQLAAMESVLRSRTIERLMLESGVTFVDPASAYVSARAVIGGDTVICQNVSVEGQTTIGGGCTIRPGVRIVDSQVGDGVEIRDNSFITNSTVGDGCTVGPMAHLRGHAVMEERSKVGNFVELKKTKLGKGSKASHLTYLGDATIGENTNIGAGTVTCNYDGKNKHETHIGSNVKIGSDTMLVAPVTVGNGASTGAGSVVTKDVEAHSFLIGVTATPLVQRNVDAGQKPTREKLTAEESLERMKSFPERREKFIASIKKDSD
ncbi:MAG: bifunctional UDP-N-acetylglucosamine diphosphorylase/glucosamine-1-phosphate N-acetyltransferase GlmU, partial [Acidobacteria bacterium]|nr:bifunctional UDP-N-acetylglucosamine diphosphorylase/glucosamine-1-phosphate N-acetyltransferase GlmU [Acidobacteriota bacterium]